MNERGTANKYATPSTRAIPTEYQKAKATANLLSDISVTARAMTITGFPGFGLVSTIAGVLSYSIDPDRSLSNDFNQAIGLGIDLHESTKRK